MSISENKFLRGVVVFATCATAFVLAVQMTTIPVGNARTISELDREIAAMNAKIREYQRQISQYREQADSLAAQVGILRAQEAAIQAEIDLSELQKQQLEDQIENTEQRIVDTQERLGDVIVDVHLARDLSPLERALSSRDIAEFIDREMAMSIVSNSLRQAARELQLLKSQLDEDKVGVEKILNEQTTQRNNLAATRAQQQYLLTVTRGTEQGYQNMKNAAETELVALNAERIRLWQEVNGGSNNINRQPGQKAARNYSGLLGCAGSGSGYPNHGAGLWNSRYGCNYAYGSGWDAWGMSNRHCTSYVAWALWNRFGKHVAPFGGAGNAKQWPDTAPRLMGAVANNTPAVGSAAVWDYGTPDSVSRWGHVMLVEAIYNDGWLRVSHFNYGTRGGEFSIMDIPADSAVYVHFRNR
ncbi:CHAP domain-containing protein [Candidatus Saccharibacteria bacterium]|nr:CHAP domain-containing protein [Candidatus Saccharibacteria bacterium]